MCMEHAEHCKCGARHASFHFQDNIMPPEVVAGLYCPFCTMEKGFDEATMIRDNGWTLEYDMEVARFSAHKLPAHIIKNLSPKTLFDEGYATWRGVYPGDHIDSVREREEIIKLAKVNPVEYMKKLRSWATERMERLEREGWRKAKNAA